MTPHRHARTRRGMERLFGGEPVADPSALYAELARCPACAAYHTELAQQEAALSGLLDGVTRHELERVECLVLGQPKVAAVSRWPWRWLAPSAVAVAVAVTAFVVVGPRQDAPLPEVSQELVARSGVSSNSAVGVRAFLVSRSPRPWTTDAPAEPLSIVSFTYTNLQPGVRYLVLLGAQAHGEVLRYYPREDTPLSIPVQEDVVDQPLGHGFELAVHHRPGALRVIALFSTQPLEARALQQAVLEERDRAASLEDMGLVIDDPQVFEHSFVVVIDGKN